MFLFLCTVLFQINDFQLHFNYKTVKQSSLLMYTQCKLLQETCIRNEAHSEHINWKGWFSFSSKRRRNGRESHLYETNAKGLSVKGTSKTYQKQPPCRLVPRWLLLWHSTISVLPAYMIKTFLVQIVTVIAIPERCLWLLNSINNSEPKTR